MNVITIRKADERGHADHGWLQTRHSFSFAQYHDPEHMSFGPLRVINEDWIAPTRGFGMHPHQDMEIITYVVSGQLEHRDSMGHGSTIQRGDIQAMTAGTGILHSERNPSPDEPVHLYQIWIMPDAAGLEPRYAERRYAEEVRANEPLLLVSGQDEGGALRIQRDAKLYTCRLEAERSLDWTGLAERQLWLQLVSGDLEIDGQALATGDAAAVSGQEAVTIQARTDCELLLFDMA